MESPGPISRAFVPYEGLFLDPAESEVVLKYVNHIGHALPNAFVRVSDTINVL